MSIRVPRGRRAAALAVSAAATAALAASLTACGGPASAASSGTGGMTTASATTHGGGVLSHPLCKEGDLTVASQASTAHPNTVYIALHDKGPTCRLHTYLPYVVIAGNPVSSKVPDVRPLIPSGLGGGPMVIKKGQTLYSALDLAPAGKGGRPGYRYLAVTPDPTPNSTGKDVDYLKLTRSHNVAKPRLSMYYSTKSAAYAQLRNSDTPER